MHVGNDDSVLFDLATTNCGDAPFRIDDEFVFFLDLGGNIANDEAFEKWNQLEIDLDERAKGDGLVWNADGIFDLVGPDILHRLEED